MVDALTLTTNGDGAAAPPRTIPEVVHASLADIQSIPSPGAQRALKAETGRGWDAMMGSDADSADRTQTQIWMLLRKTIRDVKWSECEDVSIALEDGPAPDPSQLAASASLPGSAASGS